VPSLTGNGELLRKSNFDVEESEAPKITPREIAIGLMMAACIYTFSSALSKEILPGFGDVKIHTFAYMVIIVAIVNACGICSEEV
ncbi:citrate:sodium symporter, partial [Vibrio parahaemolyticus]|nr:citrate:sodium symporter [Vibrio parahaemolyticus]